MRKNNIRAQVVMEFLFVTIIALLILIFFMQLMKDNLRLAAEEQDDSAADNLGDTIRNEVVLARQVHDNYVRRFTIPRTLNGKAYSLELAEKGMYINLGDGSKFISFPTEVKGAFLKDNEAGFLDYCLTKTGEQIRISRNQVSLENASEENSFSVPPGEEFTLFVRANCIFNLQSLSFKINHSGLVLDEMVTTHEQKSIPANPFTISRWGTKEWQVFLYDTACGPDCRKITIIGLGEGPSGSGYVAAFNFTAVAGSTVSISDLKIIDASISPSSSGYIPPSTVGAVVGLS